MEIMRFEMRVIINEEGVALLPSKANYSLELVIN